MRETIRIGLIFILTMILILTLSTVIQHAVGPKPAPEAEEPAEKTETFNEMNEKGAAVITLSDDASSVSGLGARAAGSVVTVVYPGTYRVEGTLTDGQLVVDLGDYSGAVYLILNGASITNSRGPALQVVQADRTTVYLADGSKNELTDAAGYTILSAGEYHPGAALYSADDLVIEGGGQLTITGNAADGLRVKDALTIAGGALNISGADDGIQANDRLTVSGGSLLIGAGGDGINVSLGAMELTGGYLWINADGDAVSALTDLTVSGGTINATACGGSDMYTTVALNDLSAKGLKAETITITGGTLDLDAADDAIHADDSITITGGSFSLSSGDDALHADGLLSIRGGVTIDIVTCYEGLEGDMVYADNVWVRAFAQNNGVDAGTGGLTLERGTLELYAPRIIGSEGTMNVAGTVMGSSDGTKTPFAFLTSNVTGSIQIYCTAGSAQALLAEGELPASLLFVLPGGVPAETAVTLYDAAGGTLYTATTTESGGAFLFAGSPLVLGQTYTLTAGENAWSAVLTAGCTVTPEQTNASGEPSGEFRR